MKIEIAKCCTKAVCWDNIKPGEVVKSESTGQYYIKSDQGFGVRLSNGSTYERAAMNRASLIRVEATVVIE